ncbi:hypothetical protein HRED_04592, partial [Candidatus Haloredivivus sp. G17]
LSSTEAEDIPTTRQSPKNTATPIFLNEFIRERQAPANQLEA